MTLWCDNCSGQNKNWTLISAIVHLLSDPGNRLDSVTLKFFEKGHTVMRADSFHHTVEDEIRKKILYDFQDFVDCVNERGNAVTMETNEFYDFKNEKGSGKDVQCPLLKTVSVIQLRNGSAKLFWKESFNEEVFKESEFLKKKTRKVFAENSEYTQYAGKGGKRGITHKKKEEILLKLSKFMHANRLRFWKKLP